jgi:translation initiation factor 1
MSQISLEIRTGNPYHEGAIDPPGKDPSMPNSRLVYSTETGGRCPICGRSQKSCTCGKNSAAATQDGVVRIRREVKGRAGKTVTTVSGLQFQGEALEEFASEIKRRCSTGGTVKDGILVLQGDQRAKVVSILQSKGIKVKQAGG